MRKPKTKNQNKKSCLQQISKPKFFFPFHAKKKGFIVLFLSKQTRSTKSFSWNFPVLFFFYKCWSFLEEAGSHLLHEILDLVWGLFFEVLADVPWSPQKKCSMWITIQENMFYYLTKVKYKKIKTKPFFTPTVFVEFVFLHSLISRAPGFIFIYFLCKYFLHSFVFFFFLWFSKIT